MTPLEGEYRNTVNRVASALLVFEGLFLLLGAVMAVVPLLTESLSLRAQDVIYEMVYGILYAAVFTVPVLFFGWISSGKPRAPIYLARKLPRETPLYIFAGIAVITAAAYVNSFLVSIFDYTAFSSEVIWGQDVSANYQLILTFFTMAVVPAFVEELLFRGVILSNLLPYGRTTAVFASAILFGVMHQNAEQLFYATAAGLVLGFIYVKTESIWTCVLLHFVNNFTSVLQTVFYERLPIDTANLVVGVMQFLIFGAGLLSAVLLLLRQRDTRAAIFETGCFEKDLPADPEYAQVEIPLRRRVRLFFSVPMIVFFAVCLLQMLSLVLMAVLLY